jgi:diadenosine tetraphosphate (Ap4A) HIT family hydrolase
MSSMPPACLICDRVRAVTEGRNPYLVAEFDRSVFVVGDHQFYPGYSLVLLKEHVTELHHLPADALAEHTAEVVRAGRAVHEEFDPWKLNYACYGNGEPHLHWHIFPRTADDPNRTLPPWTNWEQFESHTIHADEARRVAARLAARLR